MTSDLRYSEPLTATVQTHAVDNADDVDQFAAELLHRYQAENDVLPGIELRRPGGESLSIAVAPFGWALIHTSADFDQHCTRNTASAAAGGNPDGTHDVRWEEPDAVPHDWFIPAALAHDAVAQWLTDGSLASEVTWSDDCL